MLVVVETKTDITAHLVQQLLSKTLAHASCWQLAFLYNWENAEISSYSGAQNLESSSPRGDHFNSYTKLYQLIHTYIQYSYFHIIHIIIYSYSTYSLIHLYQIIAKRGQLISISKFSRAVFKWTKLELTMNILLDVAPTNFVCPMQYNNQGFGAPKC